MTVVYSDIDDTCEKCGSYNNKFVVCNECYDEVIELLKKVTEKDRDVDEGDCVFCGCELGSGDDETGNCYSDCVMVEIRKLLPNAAQQVAQRDLLPGG